MLISLPYQRVPYVTWWACLLMSVYPCASQVKGVFRVPPCLNVRHGCKRQASLYRPEMEPMKQMQFNLQMSRPDALTLLTGCKYWLVQPYNRGGPSKY